MIKNKRNHYSESRNSLPRAVNVNAYLQRILNENNESIDSRVLHIDCVYLLRGSE